MSTAKAGDIRIVNLGRSAKVRPCLMLTPQPRGDGLDVFSLLAQVIAVRAKRWKVFVQKLFRDRAGTFEGRRMATVACMKLVRELGELTGPGADLMLNQKAGRLGL